MFRTLPLSQHDLLVYVRMYHIWWDPPVWFCNHGRCNLYVYRVYERLCSFDGRFHVVFSVPLSLYASLFHERNCHIGWVCLLWPCNQGNCTYQRRRVYEWSWAVVEIPPQVVVVVTPSFRLLGGEGLVEGGCWGEGAEFRGRRCREYLEWVVNSQDAAMVVVYIAWGCLFQSEPVLYQVAVFALGGGRMTEMILYRYLRLHVVSITACS